MSSLAVLLSWTSNQDEQTDQFAIYFPCCLAVYLKRTAEIDIWQILEMCSHPRPIDRRLDSDLFLLQSYF